MPKHLLRDQEPFHRPSDSEVRAGVGRIVDILQQLVLLRPDMIVPLEEIVTGIVETFRTRIVTPVWEGQDELRFARPPLPPVPLSELPMMLALLEVSTGQQTTRRRTGMAGRQKRPR